MRPAWAFALLLFGATLAATACSRASENTDTERAEADAADSFTIYLVRHAEKETGEDPALSPAGQVRATALADMFADKPIEAIWSTDYRRTQATAAPLAQSLQIPVETYDPSNLEAFAETLETRGETALIVGHSNTTPQLVEALGGAPGEPINEAAEYDRLYTLSGIGTGTVDTQIERYGASGEPGN